MKGRPIDQLVYEYMFPKPRVSDPQNFHALLQRNLILEVRSEVHSFYGHLDTQEAKYPGLDYCHPIHRIRLSRWPWHRRLFRAFDNLRLTPSEIANLTKWEGTRWAKERFEKEQGIVIKDTAADGIPDWVEPEDRPATTTRSRRARSVQSQASLPAEPAEPDGPETDEDELQSVGAVLNERLRERVALREAGETSTVLDEEWEQWLKNAIDSGELYYTAERILQQAGESPPVPASLYPPQMLSAARAGNWGEIPEFLHPMIRRTLSTETDGQDSAPDDEPTPTEAPPSPGMSPLTRMPRRDIAEVPTNGVDSAWRMPFSFSDMAVRRTAEPPGA